jgi:hypothetical protein
MVTGISVTDLDKSTTIYKAGDLEVFPKPFRFGNICVVVDR